MSDERRERYVEAIVRVDDTTEATWHLSAADAAMAVADEEQQGCGCESHVSNEECEGPVWVVLRGLREEVQRLRAELAKLNQSYAYALNVGKEQQATIDRLRAELDTTDKIAWQNFAQMAKHATSIERFRALAERTVAICTKGQLEEALKEQPDD